MKKLQQEKLLAVVYDHGELEESSKGFVVHPCLKQVAPTSVKSFVTSMVLGCCIGLRYMHWAAESVVEEKEEAVPSGSCIASGDRTLGAVLAGLA
jgi:hypothetical protein